MRCIIWTILLSLIVAFIPLLCIGQFTSEFKIPLVESTDFGTFHCDENIKFIVIPQHNPNYNIPVDNYYHINTRLFARSGTYWRYIDTFPLDLHLSDYTEASFTDNNTYFKYKGSNYLGKNVILSFALNDYTIKPLDTITGIDNLINDRQFFSNKDGTAFIHLDFHYLDYLSQNLNILKYDRFNKVNEVYHKSFDKKKRYTLSKASDFHVISLLGIGGANDKVEFYYFNDEFSCIDSNYLYPKPGYTFYYPAELSSNGKFLYTHQANLEGEIFIQIYQFNLGNWEEYGHPFSIGKNEVITNFYNRNHYSVSISDDGQLVSSYNSNLELTNSFFLVKNGDKYSNIIDKIPFADKLSVAKFGKVSPNGQRFWLVHASKSINNEIDYFAEVYRINLDSTETVDNQVNIISNPVLHNLDVFTNHTSEITYTIYTSLGQWVTRGYFTQLVQIDMSNYPSGVYFINFENGTSSTTRKFVKL